MQQQSCKKIACAIGVFIWVASLVIVNTLVIEYWYYPVKDKTYSSHTCMVENCITEMYSTTKGLYMNVSFVIEYNNYSANAYIFRAAYVENYCNITKTFTCYSYDDDITSLTITESDLNRWDTFGVLMVLILLIDFLGFGIFGFIIFAICLIVVEMHDDIKGHNKKQEMQQHLIQSF